MWYRRRMLNLALGGSSMSVFNTLFGWFLNMPQFYFIAVCSFLLSIYGFWRLFNTSDN